MKADKLFFLLLLLIVAGFLGLGYAYSYFSNTGQSTNNILSAAAVFPSATPTRTSTPLPVTNTPTPTATPTPANCTQYCQSIGSTMLGCTLNLNKCTDITGTRGIQNNSYCVAPNNFCCCQ